MPKILSVTPPASCTLCPRRCRADRAAGQVGFCGAGRTLKAARAALHFWEEPCISGKSGSGARGNSLRSSTMIWSTTTKCPTTTHGLRIAS